MWRARWRQYSAANKPKERMRFIGECESMTEAEARETLADLIRRSNGNAGQVGHLGPLDLLHHCVAAEKTPRGGKFHGWNGQVAEHLVCADLLSKGIEVFVAAHPQSSCDLICLKDGEPIRIEVKWCEVDEDGCAQVNLTRQAGKFDVLAVVDRGGIIHYRGVYELNNLRNPIVGIPHEVLPASGN